MDEELQMLKNKNKRKIDKQTIDIKYYLNIYHLAIIILILLIMIIYTVYKIGYFIFLNKYINYKFYRKADEDNSQKNGNKNNTIINNNNNNQKYDDFYFEDMLIPNSYSNYLEDVILNIFFYDINNGYYLDISSFGDNKKSTTRYFYLKGWNGITLQHR